MHARMQAWVTARDQERMQSTWVGGEGDGGGTWAWRRQEGAGVKRCERSEGVSVRVWAWSGTQDLVSAAATRVRGTPRGSRSSADPSQLCRFSNFNCFFSLLGAFYSFVCWRVWFGLDVWGRLRSSFDGVYVFLRIYGGNYDVSKEFVEIELWKLYSAVARSFSFLFPFYLNYFDFINLFQQCEVCDVYEKNQMKKKLLPNVLLFWLLETPFMKCTKHKEKLQRSKIVDELIVKHVTNTDWGKPHHECNITNHGFREGQELTLLKKTKNEPKKARFHSILPQIRQWTTKGTSRTTCRTPAAAQVVHPRVLSPHVL